MWFTDIELDALKRWIGLYWNGEWYKPLEDLSRDYKDSQLYKLTQEYLKSRGKSKITLYRWETGNSSHSRLQSWVIDKQTAMSYKKYRPGGKLLVKSFPIEKVFFTFDIDMMNEEDDSYEEDFYWATNIYWRELLGTYPCQEYIVFAE